MPRRRVIELLVSVGAITLLAIAAGIGGVASKGSQQQTTGATPTSPAPLTLEAPTRVPTLPDGYRGVAYAANAGMAVIPGYAMDDTAGTRIKALIPRGTIIIETKPVDGRWQQVKLDTALGLGALQKKFEGMSFLVARSQLVPVTDARSSNPGTCAHWSSWIVNRRNFPSVSITERVDTQAPATTINTRARHLWLTCTTLVANATIPPGADIPVGTQLYEVVDSGRDIEGVHRAFVAGQGNPASYQSFWKFMDPADTANRLQPELVIPSTVPVLPSNYRGSAYIASTNRTVTATTLDNAVSRELPRGLILSTQPLDDTWQQVQTFGGWAKVRRTDLVPIPKKCTGTDDADEWFAFPGEQSQAPPFQAGEAPVGDAGMRVVTSQSLGLSCLSVVPSASIPAGSAIPDDAVMYERVRYPAKTIRGSTLVSGDFFYAAFTYGDRLSSVDSGTWQYFAHNRPATWKRP